MRNAIAILMILIVAVCAAAAAQTVHVVQPGETVYSIARSYNVSPDAVLAVNGIKDPRTIKPGQKLVIPSVYRVRKGDTFYGIARKHGISVEELLKANKLTAAATLKAGDLLYVPAGASGMQGSPETQRAGNPTGTAASNTAAKPPETATPAPAASAGASGPTPAKVDASGPWPATGTVSYLEGKLYGVMIETSTGSKIVAVRNGTVVSAGPFRGYGLVCFVQAPDGLVYVYGGASRQNVKVGDAVRPGVEVGIVGADMETGKPIAYFFVFKNGKAVDPAKVIRDR
ncbi:MAG: LysM peptidoglycan-binding domain-containing protein [Spirochaetes bacterium]|nr:LysM peptidoglycan-binding domain-containing protein [Spirochaetota bacterium]